MRSWYSYVYATAYDAALYESILALPGVQALCDDIDANQTGGLGTVLKEELHR